MSWRLSPSTWHLFSLCLIGCAGSAQAGIHFTLLPCHIQISDRGIITDTQIRSALVLDETPGTENSHQNWAEFLSSWHQTLVKQLKAVRFDRYVRATGPLPHPSARMAKRFGITALNGELHVPPAAQLFEQAESMLVENLRTHGLSPSDAIRGARVFSPVATVREEDNSDIEFLSWPFEADNGWFAVSVDPKPRRAGKMIRSGYYPLGAPKSIRHDFIGHIFGFLEHPLYMAKLRRALNEPNSLPARDFYARYAYLLEGLSLVDTSKRHRLAEFLSEPLQSEEDRLVTVEELRLFLCRRSQRDNLNHTLRLLSALPSLVTHYGGSSRDANMYPFFVNHSEMRQTLMTFEYETRALLSVFLQKSQDQILYRHLLHRLAMLEVALHESARIPMDAFFDQLLSPIPKPGSDVYRMFVLSGISEDPGYQLGLTRQLGFKIPMSGPGLLMRSLKQGLSPEDEEELVFKRI